MISLGDNVWEVETVCETNNVVDVLLRWIDRERKNHLKTIELSRVVHQTHSKQCDERVILDILERDLILTRLLKEW